MSHAITRPVDVLAALAILALGGLGYATLAARSARGEEEPQPAPAPSVRVTPVARARFEEPVVGRGIARAPRAFAVQALIEGRVASLARELESGSQVVAGEELYRLDPETVHLALREAAAALAQARDRALELELEGAQLEERVRSLEGERSVYEELVGANEEAREIARAQLERSRRLLEQDAMAKSAEEQARKAFVEETQRYLEAKARLATFAVEVETARGRIALVAARRKTAAAEVEAAASRLERIQLDEGRTSIRSPVTGSVVLVDPETGTRSRPPAEGDLVAKGQVLGWVLPRSGAIEVPVALDVGEAFRIRGAHPEREFDPDTVFADVPEVRVEWAEDPGSVWVGRLVRLEAGFERRTGMITVVVRVEATREYSRPDRKIPLVHGMECRVVFPPTLIEDAIAIPVAALDEGGRVHVARDGKIEVRQLTLGPIAGGRAVVLGGLEPGDLLVVTRLPAAAPGTRVHPVAER